MKSPYCHQIVYLGSQHQKELAIAKVLADDLGIHLMAVSWDTDTLGTFSGEIKREKSVRDTLRAKAERTHEICKKDLIIVSEGSFGPHPHMPFVNSNHEMLLFKDFARQREIFAETISLKTNIDEIEVENFNDARKFLKSAQFGSHGMIIADQKVNPLFIQKGITSLVELKRVFHQIRKDHPKVYITADMRAHMNPKRMKVIRQAAKELVKKLKSLCPKCGCPGWDVKDYIEGLPCSACGGPSTTIKELIYKCSECKYKEIKPRPDKKAFIDPFHCNYCNP